MTLHLVRLPLNLRALAAFAVASRASDDDAGYALHLALRCRFGGAGPQPFRFFAEHRAGPHLLGYTADRDALIEAAALPATDPLLAPVFGDVSSQQMPGGWRTGQRLGFEVRVRPVVRFGGRVREARMARPGAWLSRAGEIDAFLAACEKAGPQDEGDPPVSREAVYVDWLGRRLGDAASFENGTVEMRLMQRARTHRRVHVKPMSKDQDPCGAAGRARLGLRPSEGPDVVLAGTLTVGDPDAFAALLARGVGRHAAFGFGMLLLSPPKRAG